MHRMQVLSSSDRKDQGITSERNCRLSTETPGYQLDWAVLDASILYLLHNFVLGTYHKWPVYSSFTSFFLALSFYHSSNGKIISIINVNKFPHLEMHIFAISSFAIIEEMFSAETFFCHMEEMGSKLHFLSYERKLELVEIGIQ